MAIFLHQAPKQTIDHTGIVVSINGRKATIQIQPQPSCGSCGSKSICNLAEDTGKTVEATLENQDIPQPGQVVTIALERSLGYLALWLGYLLPLVILVSSLFLLVHLLGDEGFAAMLSLLILALYYATLYFLRKKIGDRYVFRIKK